MNRRVFLGRRAFLRQCAGGVMGAVFMASAAMAESFQKSVVAQLRSQGYREINVETTMLGRVRIVAARGGASREIILNPRTGEILRDIVLAADGQVVPEIAGGENSGKGSSQDDGSDDSGSGEDGSDDSDSDGSGSGDDGPDDNDSEGHDSGDDGSEDHGDSDNSGSGKGGNEN